MIFEAIAYPLGKVLGLASIWFENREKRQQILLDEQLRDNEHKRDIEMQELQARLHKEIEAVKTAGQVQIAQEATAQAALINMTEIAKSDNEVKKAILQQTPDWGVDAMTWIRLMIGVLSGLVFFYIGTVSCQLLLEMIKARSGTISSEDPLLLLFINNYETFFHSTTSLVLTYFGITHARKNSTK